MTATLLLCALLVNTSDEKHGCSSSTGEKDRRSQVHPSLCWGKQEELRVAQILNNERNTDSHVQCKRRERGNIESEPMAAWW